MEPSSQMQITSEPKSMCDDHHACLGFTCLPREGKRLPTPLRHVAPTRVGLLLEKRGRG